MMVGAGFLDGSVPDIDATIVTRILDDGGEIAGKACAILLRAPAAATPADRPGAEPRSAATPPAARRRQRGAGRGRRGTMAIGGDQAGSIRSGELLRHRRRQATFGLVPYTGIGPLEITVDTVGPMSRERRRPRCCCEVVAGPDGLDCASSDVKVENTPRRLAAASAVCASACCARLRPESEADVEAKVRAAADRFNRWARTSKRCRCRSTTPAFRCGRLSAAMPPA